jgi:hypothetical protein
MFPWPSIMSLMNIIALLIQFSNISDFRLYLMNLFPNIICFLTKRLTFVFKDMKKNKFKVYKWKLIHYILQCKELLFKWYITTNNWYKYMVWFTEYDTCPHTTVGTANIHTSTHCKYKQHCTLVMYMYVSCIIARLDLHYLHVWNMCVKNYYSNGI